MDKKATGQYSVKFKYAWEVTKFRTMFEEGDTKIVAWPYSLNAADFIVAVNTYGAE